MYFKLNYDKGMFSGLAIRPDEIEDPDTLHEYSKILKVKNPAITFTKIVKAGDLNELDDEEYDTALKRIKRVSAFWDNKSEANVFHVLDKAIEYILGIEEYKAKLEAEAEAHNFDDGFESCDLSYIFDDNDDNNNNDGDGGNGDDSSDEDDS